MFKLDEKEDFWLDVYKGLIKLGFWLYLVAGGVLSIFGWMGHVGVTGYSPLDGFIILAIGFVVAFAHVYLCMPILQFLSNVQCIRRILENNQNSEK